MAFAKAETVLYHADHDLPYTAVLKAGAPGSDRRVVLCCALGPVVAVAAGASSWAAAATLDRERAGARVR